MNTADNTYKSSPKRFRMPVCDKVINTEISNDYTLPDYLPEIRRILRVCVSPMPPAKYISGSSAEFSGAIDYTLLYVGADGAIHSAPLTAEYNFNAPLDLTSDFDLGEGVISVCRINEETLTTRVSAPRKLTIKCRLSAQVKASCMMVFEEKIFGEVNENSIEELREERISVYPASLTGETLELTASFPLTDESTRVADVSASAVIQNATAKDGYIDYSGELLLTLLVCKEDTVGDTEKLQKKLPFSDRISADEISAEDTASMCIYVNDISVNIEESKILCTVNILPELTLYKASPINYTRDLFSTEKYCEGEYTSYPIPTLLSATVGNFSQSERIPLAETPIAHGSSVLEVKCKPYVEKAERDKTKHMLSGTCKYSLLLECDGDFSTYELAVPFRYECDGPDADVKEYDTDIFALSTNSRIDGANLCIDTELSVTTRFLGEEEITTLSAARFGEDIPRTSGEMIICYPAPDDTVWSVAKKYSVPVSKISSMANYILINA